MSRSLSIFAMLWMSGALAAQGGYEWDHPDGVGVRYLLYKKLGRANVNPTHYPDQMRAVYTPKDDKDYIRVKGHPMAWGLYVYEFGNAAAGGPKDATDFLKNHDPRRRHRRFLQEEGGRYWEFTDRFERYVVKLDKPKPSGRLRWGACGSLGVRFLIDKSMGAVGQVAKVHDRCLMLPATSDWVRIKGRKKPVSWSMMVSEFGIPKPKPAPEAKKARVWSKTFAEHVGKIRRSVRTITVRGRKLAGRGFAAVLYEYRDDYSKRGGLVMHHVAVSYRTPDREIVLDAKVPALGDEPDPKLWRRARKMVTSLVPYRAAATSGKGQYTYNVASACSVGGEKEVALVAFIPVAKGRRPTAAQIAQARKMVKSLRPAK